MKMRHELQKTKLVFRPTVLNWERFSDRKKIDSLLDDSHVQVHDDIEKQWENLFLVRHPQLRGDSRATSVATAAWNDFLKRTRARNAVGRWVFFPWSCHLVHILGPKDFFELRTARNHNLITVEEQEVVRNAPIHIAGLSVGSSAATALSLEGFEDFVLCDFDELEISNLNRIAGSVADLGLPKVFSAARRIYEMNPYAKVRVSRKKLAGHELKNFVGGENLPRVIVDEMDDLASKLELRILARKHRIPVVSVADNGDGAIADIERFDREPRRPPFHGLLGQSSPRDILRMNFGERIQLINRIVGVDYVTSRMKESLLKVGTSLYAWPQLGGAAMLSGSVVSYLVKRIILGEFLKSGKYDVNPDAIFVPSYQSAASRRKRRTETANFLKLQSKKFS